MLIALLAAIGFLTQNVTAPRVLGLGVTLSPEETAQLVQSARPVVGADVWLITAMPTMMCCGWNAQAYGLPSRSSADIRRGRFVEMMAGGRDRSALTQPKVWSPRLDPRTSEPTVREYAQVALPGRAFDDVREMTDENRPLSISGEMDDATLVGLVRFLRSQSPNPQTPQANLPPRPWAIGFIAALDDVAPRGRANTGLSGPGFRVNLNVTPTSGSTVVLQRENGAWIIRGVGYFAQ